MQLLIHWPICDTRFTMENKIAARRILPAIALMLTIASAPALAGTVSCDSYNGRRNTCDADTRNGVALARQMSWNKCKKGVSWGVQGDNQILGRSRMPRVVHHRRHVVQRRRRWWRRREAADVRII